MASTGYIDCMLCKASVLLKGPISLHLDILPGEGKRKYRTEDDYERDTSRGIRMVTGIDETRCGVSHDGQAND
jgi:hypothetical protein